MTSLEQQLSTLAEQLIALRDAIPVEADTMGVTIDRHSPGNGRIYPRLRAQKKGVVLSNGKRTMGLDEAAATEWEQKLYARNQKAKVAQCIGLIQKAADIAEGVTWNFDEMASLVNNSKQVTKGKKKKAAAPSRQKKKPKVALKYVFKDGKGATTINRKVHAISAAEPDYGRWYSPALCGERPKAGSWGWRTCDASELDCPKCYAKVKMLS
ncbi:MAG: hypothetical protein AAGM45_17800 [Cyanobacteria bacterium J06588_5]